MLGNQIWKVSAIIAVVVVMGHFPSKTASAAKVWCRTTTPHDGKLVHEVTLSRCEEMGGSVSGGKSFAEIQRERVENQGEAQEEKSQSKAEDTDVEKAQKVWCRTTTPHDGKLVHEVTLSRCEEMGGSVSGGKSFAEIQRERVENQGEAQEEKSQSKAEDTDVEKRILEAVKAERERLTDQMTDLLAGQAKLRKKLEVVTADRGKLREGNMALHEAKQNLEKALQRLEQKRHQSQTVEKQLEGEVDALLAERKLIEKKNAEAKHKLLLDQENLRQGNKDNILRLELQVASLIKSLEETKEQLDQVRSNLKHSSQTHKSEIALIQNQVAQLNEQLRESVAKYTDTLENNKTIQEKFAAVRQDYAVLQSKYEPFIEELEARFATEKLRKLVVLGERLVADVKVFLQQNPTLRELPSLLQLNRQLKASLQEGKIELLDNSYKKMVVALEDIQKFADFVKEREKKKQAEVGRKKKEEADRKRKAEVELIEKGEQLALAMRKHVVMNMDADDIDERLAVLTVLEESINGRDFAKILEIIEAELRAN